MKYKITLTESTLVDKLINHLTDCDSDELARISGEVFGGDCTSYFDVDSMQFDNLYDFEPNENYTGELD